jgi:hypothetical protein
VPPWCRFVSSLRSCCTSQSQTWLLDQEHPGQFVEHWRFELLQQGIKSLVVEQLGNVGADLTTSNWSSLVSFNDDPDGNTSFKLALQDGPLEEIFASTFLQLLQTTSTGSALEVAIRLVGEPLRVFSKVLGAAAPHWSVATRPVQTQGSPVSLDGAAADSVASVPAQVPSSVAVTPFDGS